ncbi:MAG: hypothetical protein RJA35_1337 [Actinomycetota bacterium]|jgi:secretion/DNA translocation related TadE-like protein
MTWLRKAKGSASILVLAILFALVFLSSIDFAAYRLLAARQELQESVDLAAIAADQVSRGLNTGIPCYRARQILTLNMSNLDSCLIVGSETKVAGYLRVMGIVLNATATAAAN